MGFDITFHPVDKQDLQHYLFDVIDNPSLSETRAQELTRDVEKQETVKSLYAQFPEWLDDMSNFDDSLYRSKLTLRWRIWAFFGRYPNKFYEIGLTFGFAAAAIAGFRHPYWYSRGSAISFLRYCAPLVRLMVTPLPKLSPGALSKVTDVGNGWITANFCGSGYIEAGRVRSLESYMLSLEQRKTAEGRPIIYEVFDDESLRAFKAAVKYAKENNVGLVEASDIVVPFSGGCASDPDNLRADFVKNQGS